MLATASVVFFAACIVTPVAAHVAMARRPVNARAAFDVRSPARSMA